MEFLTGTAVDEAPRCLLIVVIGSEEAQVIIVDLRSFCIIKDESLLESIDNGRSQTTDLCV